MEHLLADSASVLIVDDEPDLLLIMKTRLSRLGYRVQVCYNAEGVFDILESTPPDIIILDIQMKGVSGSEICEQLKKKKEFRHIPVLMFSANEDIAQVTDACGADGFIAKPFDANLLKQEIDRQLKKHR